MHKNGSIYVFPRAYYCTGSKFNALNYWRGVYTCGIFTCGDFSAKSILEYCRILMFCQRHDSRTKNDILLHLSNVQRLNEILNKIIIKISFFPTMTIDISRNRKTGLFSTDAFLKIHVLDSLKYHWIIKKFIQLPQSTLMTGSALWFSPRITARRMNKKKLTTKKASADRAARV